MTATDKTREECLRRAWELDWLTENSVSQAGAALAYDRARLWRSLALVALPAACIEAADKARHPTDESSTDESDV
jgi:hypothetical protein